MKTIFALIAATLLSTLFVQPSVSQSTAEHHSIVENTKTVSYLGVKNEMLVFEVKLHLNDNELKILSIYDEVGNEIYSERIRTNTFVKQYMIAKSSVGKIQFTLRGKKSIMNETFQVNYRTEERLEISKAR